MVFVGMPLDFVASKLKVLEEIGLVRIMYGFVISDRNHLTTHTARVKCDGNFADRMVCGVNRMGI